MEASYIMQYIVDSLREQEKKGRGSFIISVDNIHSIQIDRDDIDKLQKLLNISDFVEQVTKDMMKQFLFNLGKENLSR